jgi:hypothetical protein
MEKPGKFPWLFRLFSFYLLQSKEKFYIINGITKLETEIFSGKEIVFYLTFLYPRRRLHCFYNFAHVHCFREFHSNDKNPRLCFHIFLLLEIKTFLL